MKKITIITLSGMLAIGLLASDSSVIEATDGKSVKSAPCKMSYAEPINLGPVFPWHQEPIDFYFDVDARFQVDLTKSILKKMTRVTDFDGRVDVDRIVEVQSTSVTILNDELESVKQAFGTSNQLTEEQLELIASAPYSTDIRIRMDYMENSDFYEKPQRNYTSPYFTIIPKYQAVYEGGKDNLLNYLKEHSREDVKMVQKDHLKAGKVRFTVTKSGNVKDVSLISTSGYGSIDKTMLKLIAELPGTWTPAKNASGNKVDEQLVLSFGIIGC